MPERMNNEKQLPNLDGMVYCAGCGGQMKQDRGEYHCYNQDARECPSQPAKSDDLFRNVMSIMVARTITDKTLDEVVKGVRERVDPMADEQRDRMQGIDLEAENINRTKHRILQDVEAGNRTISEAAGEINQINTTGVRLAQESCTVREEMELLEFIGNEDGIRDTLRDMKTYLESSHPEIVQELIQISVRRVMVGTGRAIVIYRQPMKTPNSPEGIWSDQIMLG